MRKTVSVAPIRENCVTGADAVAQPQVFNVRGKRVVLDREVAAYVGMSTGNLNLAVKRNIHLFDEEKRFKLSEDECLIFQFAISNAGNRGGVRKPPYAFTAEGIQVLERVLKREIPIEFEDESAEVDVLPESSSEGTVVLYQPNENIRIDVRVDNETVWLTQEQMALLFGTTQPNIAMHIRNIYDDAELEIGATYKDFLYVQTEGGRQKSRYIKIYNLDMIISVGYRVNTKNGIAFRQWATRVLRNKLLHKSSLERRVVALEEQTKSLVVDTENRFSAIEEKVELIVETNIPKKYGIFSGDTVYDAHMFVSSLVEKAQQKIILIDPYIDSSVLTLLTKREPGVNVTIYFDRNKLYNPAAFNQDLALHNKQYPTVSVLHVDKLHDRFLIIDEEVYLFGASIKDLGKKMSGFAIIPFNEQEVLQKIGVKH